MEWLLKHAEFMATICGAALAGWALFSKIDKTYRAHLKDEFATKADFHRLEEKIDRVLWDMITPARRRRVKKKTSA